MHNAIETLNRTGVAAVARALGRTVRRKDLGPCPACEATQRGSADRRLPVLHGRTHEGWSCTSCGTTGDAATFASLAITGQRRPADWSDVARRVGLGDVEPPPAPTPGPRPFKRPLGAAALWDRCRPVTEAPPVAAWLRLRGLDPGDVEDRDLCRALPGSGLPDWANLGKRSWADGGHKAVVPFYDHTGAVLSVHARSLDLSAKPKGLSPRGYETAGLCFADATALAMIRGDLVPSAVVITEGVPDYLTEACSHSDADEDAPAVLSVLAGSWNDSWAATIPTSCTVILATHADDAGDRYAAAIARTLQHHDVRRDRRENTPPVAERGAA